MVPRASAGFRMFAASMDPGVLPAPMMVCISSINIIMSGFFSSSCMSPRMRSSNCPRYFVPATMAVMSRLTTRLLKSAGLVLWCTMSCASPSTIALFPTPGSPMSMGLFFFRRPRISQTRCISRSRPTTGSSLSSAAAFVRSVLKLSRMGVFDLPSRLCVVAVVFPPWWSCMLCPLWASIIGSSSSSSSGISTPSTVLFVFLWSADAASS